MPALQSASPRITLKPIYSNAVKDCPFCIRFTFSSAKVEKVVNPPQKPEASNIYVPCCTWCLLSSPNSSPMISEPTTLIAKVANGKGWSTYLLTI